MALTVAERSRLDAFAAWRIRGLGRKAGGRTFEDLFNEAVRATLDGTRSWNRDKVDFFGYLIGAMKSISDNWGKRFRDDDPVLESDLSRDDVGGSALDRLAAHTPSPEEELARKQQLEAIRRDFADDPVISRIVLDLCRGESFAEICQKHGLAPNELNAAIKRIRRRVARQAEKVSHA